MLAWAAARGDRDAGAGAGFGGLELTARLSDELGKDVDVTLIDKSDSFVFGFSKLDVMFGRTVPDAVRHPYRDIVKPGVTFVQSTIRSIDASARRVETDDGTFDADVLVIALGADLDPSATPGLVEGGHEFYTVEGAFALRDVLAEFDGGRIVVGVTSTPFKCPPAPSETAFLVHDMLVRRGIRERSEVALVMPLPVPIPPSPPASKAILAAFAERGIEWHPSSLVLGLDPASKMVELPDGVSMPYDLFLGVPKHCAPSVVAESGLCVDGWIPVDPLTLETSASDVYAVGDVTSVGTPKAGVFAEGQAGVVADAIVARHRGHDTAPYDGRGICYLEVGDDLVARVQAVFRVGETPYGEFDPPSVAYAEEKSEFGSDRIRRWFGRDWVATAG